MDQHKTWAEHMVLNMWKASEFEREAKEAARCGQFFLDLLVKDGVSTEDIRRLVGVTDEQP